VYCYFKFTRATASNTVSVILSPILVTYRWWLLI
jgi:hypothetical protein